MTPGATLFSEWGMELTTLVMTRIPQTNAPTLPLKKKCQNLPRVLQTLYKLQCICSLARLGMINDKVSLMT